MIGDKLTQDQRLRLEALAQATRHNSSAEVTVERARIYESYLRGEEK